MALRSFQEFANVLFAELIGDKTEFGQEVPFLGLPGSSPCEGNGEGYRPDVPMGRLVN